MKFLQSILIIGALIFPTQLFAQEIEVILNQTIRYEPVGTAEIVLDFKIVNISPVQQTVFEVRTINNLPSGWTSSLCFDLCFSPEVDSIATTPVYGENPLQPGDTLDTSVHFFTDQVTIATGYVQLEVGTFYNPGNRITINFVGTTDPTVWIPPILVETPNGGEIWQIFTTHQISWESYGINNVKIDYSTNNGTSWQLIVNNYPANSGNYSWFIPNTTSTACRVRISDVQNPTTNDISDNTFTISNPPAITVTLPNGGENWIVGNVQNIMWTSISVTNVKIEYTTNNGTNWSTIIASTPSDGSYNWSIPNTPSSTCKVKISDATNPSIFDVSDNNFTIYELTITVISPNGGEDWHVGATENITWTSTNVYNIKIDYTTNNGSSWIQIISSVPAINGNYLWTIPNTISASCRVRISDTSNPLYNDLSDNVFSIIPYPSITVLSPNGGETFEGTTLHDIYFNSIAVDSIMIHYSSNGGSSWILFSLRLPATGIVSWTVPNLTSEICLIKVTDTEDINNFDISDNVFNITAVGWYQQNSTIWDNLYSIDMWNSTVGYSSGVNGTIIKTINGGQIWESLSTGIVEDLRSITFVTENTGWVVGDNGRILKTTNGGLSWSYQTSNTTNLLSCVYFINQNTGWAVGSNGTIRKTSDSGNSWITQQSNVTTALNSVFFYSSNVGWIVGNSGTYLKTTNSGDTWIQKTTGTTYNLNSILFTSNDRGFIVGYNGTILLSDDAGEIWTNVSTSYGNYYSISFANAETGYIVGASGQIYKSTDSGLSWFRIGSGLQYGDDLFDIAFTDLNTGWAVGENGTIIKTTTGGTGYATTTLIANIPASSQLLEVATIEGFFVGNNVLINPGGTNEEINKIIGFGSILLETPLVFDHQAGETIISLNPSSIMEEEMNEFPKEYSLLNNYPNPFNPSTIIRYAVPKSSPVQIKVFDVIGNEIVTIIDEEKPAGTYEVEFDGTGLPSGIYFYQLKAGSFVKTKKMILIK